MSNITVIIPIGPSDQLSEKLFNQLLGLFGQDVTLIAAVGRHGQDCIASSINKTKVSIVESSEGRAEQLNAGLKTAQTDFVWFVHVDSDLSEIYPQVFERLIQQSDRRLWYFDLKFKDDVESKKMRVNEFGVWFRCRFFGMPFGDQAFFMRRAHAVELGGFPLGYEYGEDHLFVWRAKKFGYKISAVKSCIGTSARKYINLGWGKVTFMYLMRTYRQALPAKLGLHPAVKRIPKSGQSKKRA